jgi:hypothetical protein
MASMQSSPTINNFVVWTNCLMAMPDANLGGKISAYLLPLHLIHWTVFGNRKSQLEEEWLPLYPTYSFHILLAGQRSHYTLTSIMFWSSTFTIPQGRKFLLYYTCQENNAEGGTNGFLSAGI